MDARKWARTCHIEAVRATDPATKAFLQELASEYESIAGEAVDVDPDDAELQHAFADRLVSLAAKRKGWGCNWISAPPGARLWWCPQRPD